MDGAAYTEDQVLMVIERLNSSTPIADITAQAVRIECGGRGGHERYRRLLEQYAQRSRIPASPWAAAMALQFDEHLNAETNRRVEEVSREHRAEIRDLRTRNLELCTQRDKLTLERKNALHDADKAHAMIAFLDRTAADARQEHVKQLEARDVQLDTHKRALDAAHAEIRELQGLVRGLTPTEQLYLL